MKREPFLMNIKNSRFANKFDLNSDGNPTEEEIKRSMELLELELKEEKAITQTRIAIAAFVAACVYALLPVIPYVPLERLPFIDDMSGVFLLGCVSIIGFYFGATAYMSK